MGNQRYNAKGCRFALIVLRKFRLLSCGADERGNRLGFDLIDVVSPVASAFNSEVNDVRIERN